RRAAHRRRLRERFGPEYDRAAERRGSRRGADAELDERLDRHDRLDLRSLGPESREAYAARWDEVQSRFVDAPEAAVRHAQVLLGAVMAERGYPIGAALTARVDPVSADRPEPPDTHPAPPGAGGRAGRGRTGRGRRGGRARRRRGRGRRRGGPARRRRRPAPAHDPASALTGPPPRRPSTGLPSRGRAG